MVFLVYKEVDFFFVCSVCKAVGEICSMWIRIFNFIFLYVDVIQFIFASFYAILFAIWLLPKDRRKRKSSDK